MKTKNHYSLLIALLLTCGLLAALTTKSQALSNLRINPAAAYGGPLSGVFDEVEYIPLETTKESLLGAIDKLIVTESSFVVGDWDTKAVYFFTLKGKLINKIKLPYQESLGMDIAYEADQKRVAIRAINWSTETGECKYYSADGKLLAAPSLKVTKEKATQVYLGGGYTLGTGICYLNRGQKAKDSVYQLFSVYKGNELYKSLLPRNQLQTTAFCRLLGSYSLMWGHPITAQNGSFYVAEPLTFAVYKVDRDTAVRAFQFILPADRVVQKALIENNNRKTIDSLADAIAYDNKTILQISKIFFSQHYLWFKLMPRVFISKPGSEIESQYNFLYDTLSGKLISLERLTPDSSTYYLQAFGHKANRDGLEYANGLFYTSLSSLELFNQWEKTKDRGAHYPPALEQYFNTQDRKSNPIIVKLKLRQQ